MDAASPQPHVSLEFAPTKDDYVGAMRSLQLARRGVRFLLGMMVAMLVSTLLLVVLRGFDIMFTWYWLFVLSLYAFMVLVLTPFSVGRQVQQSERMTALQSWSIEDTQIHVKTAFSDVKMDWGTFSKVVETKNCYLLFFAANKNMFDVLPRRAFMSAGQEAAFRSMLQRHALL